MNKRDKLKFSKNTMKLLTVLFVTVYIALFCLLFFTPFFEYSGTRFDDFVLQRGVNGSDEVLIISVTNDDVLKYDCSPAELAAMVADRFNSDVYHQPAAINIDIPAKDITEKSAEIIKTAAEKKDNIILSVGAETDPTYMIDSYGKERGPLEAVSCVEPGYSLADYVHLGHNEQILDDNGVVRHTVFTMTAEKPLNETQAFGEEGGKSEKITYKNSTLIAYELYCKENGVAENELKDCGGGHALINFVKSEQIEVDYTADEILNGNYFINIFTGKIVLIGYTDSLLDNGYYTAYDYHEKMHSVIIDANAAVNMLTYKFAFCMPIWLQTIILVIAITLMAVGYWRLKPFISVSLTVIYMFFTIIIHTLLNGIGYHGCVMPHIVNAIFTGLVMAVVIYVRRAVTKRNEMESVLATYMDTNVAKSIINDKLEDVYEGDNSEIENRSIRSSKIAVFFADIRNFTTISEKTEAEKLVHMLNLYLSMMAECVKKYGGTLDKFIGDCAMAYWGAPKDDEDACYHACLCASEIQRRSKEMNETVRREIGYDLRIGIGINYGDAVVGNIGSEGRLNYTALGDTVNTASRIEGQTPGNEIYISSSVAEKLEDRAEVRQLEKTIRLKGKENPVPIYSLKSITLSENNKKAKDKEEKKVNEKAVRRAKIGVVTDIAITVLQFLFVFQMISNLGVKFMLYFPAAMSMIGAAAFLAILVYDIMNIKKGEINNNIPYYVNILLLTGVASTIQCAFSMFFTSTAESGTEWLGNPFLCIIIPLLALIYFFVIHRRYKYKVYEVLLGLLPFAVFLVINIVVSVTLGFNIRYPEQFNVFYKFPNYLFSFGFELAIMTVLVVLNNLMKLQDRIDISKITLFNKLFEKMSNSRFSKVLRNNRRKSIILAVIKLFIATVTVQPMIYSMIDGSLACYAIADICGVFIAVVCVASAALYIKSFFNGMQFKQHKLNKFCSIIMQTGTTVSFLMAIVMLISTGGFETLAQSTFTGILYYFVVPLLSYFAFNTENYEVKFWEALLGTVPFIGSLIFTTLTIQNDIRFTFAFATEYEIFYSQSAVYVIVVLTLTVPALVSALAVMQKRARGEMAVDRDNVRLYMCGTRNGISPYGLAESIYGLRSTCYLFRRGDYALIINAGSGIANVKDKIKDCKRIDIVFSSMDFGNIMGFLNTPVLSADARIRIFSEFDFTRFSEPPYWPVNIIKGNWVQIEEGKKFMLEAGVFCELIRADEQDEGCLIRITGPVNVSYMGKTAALPSVVRRWLTNADVLIYDGYDDYPKGCYLAIDCNIPQLIISGYPSGHSDEKLDKMQQQAKKIISDVIFAHENDEFTL